MARINEMSVRNLIRRQDVTFNNAPRVVSTMPTGTYEFLRWSPAEKVSCTSRLKEKRLNPLPVTCACTLTREEYMLLQVLADDSQSG